MPPTATDKRRARYSSRAAVQASAPPALGDWPLRAGTESSPTCRRRRKNCGKPAANANGLVSDGRHGRSGGPDRVGDRRGTGRAIARRRDLRGGSSMRSGSSAAQGRMLRRPFGEWSK